MRVAVVCADRGVPWLGRGGASSHLRGIAHGYASCGADVEVWVRTLSPRHGAPTLPPPGVRALEGPGERFGAWVGSQGRRFAPDLVHERHALDGGVGDVGARWLLEVNAPLVWEEALFRGGRMHRRRLGRERAQLAAPPEVIAVSGALARWIARPGVRVVPNGVSSLPPRAVAPLPLPPSAPFVLGFEGTFKAWHGLLGEIEGLRAVPTGGRRLEVQLAGEGPERERVLAALRGAGVEAVWLGALTEGELRLARGGWSAAWMPAAPWPPPGAQALESLAGETVPERWFAPLKEAEAAAAGLPLWKGGALVPSPPSPRTWQQISRGLLEPTSDLGRSPSVSWAGPSWDSGALRS
ncbi:MAG: glycosyltransferase [Deltaproteobacteria bacterium]|nr:glycosyltransferase [Deltaproteobacteria bacterium]